MSESLDWRSWSAEKLESEIQKHDRLYWTDNSPEIEDVIYDQMVAWLKELKPGSAIFQKVAPALAPEAGRALVRHLSPMLSLDKAYQADEVVRWMERFEGEAVGSHKIDGVALSIRYGEDGELLVAATRGDGREGEDVTANARRIHGVPSKIESGPVEVRGEVWMPVSRFEALYAENFANPRNLAAGALKQKDPERTADYGLRFTPYNLLDESIPTEQAKAARLAELGFEPLDLRAGSAAEIATVFEGLLAERHQLDYETDGVVFKAARVDEQLRLGETSHHPRYAIAWKYQGETGTSTLRGVEWSVSRSGAINPVALIEPVALSGVTISRVSLHNLGIMEALHGAPLELGKPNPGNLSEGALLEVTRRGGVIPHVEAVLRPVEGGGLALPDNCPSCGAAAMRVEDLLMADHEADCSVAGRRRIEHFAARIDLEGFGPKLMEQLYERELVRQPADLFRLSRADLLSLERMGERSANNLLGRIAARRELAFGTLLAALGIPGLGVTMSEQLAEAFQDLEALRAASVEEISKVEGFGELTAESVKTWLGLHSGLIDELLKEVSVTAPEPAAESADAEAPMAGLSILFTGKMLSMTRQEAQRWVISQGGQAPADYKKGMNFLVLGGADWERFQGGWRSSKLKRAEADQKAGGVVEIIEEAAFFERFGQPTSSE